MPGSSFPTPGRKAKGESESPRRTEQMAKKYLIETFGCQMNFHDSERMAGLLDQAGYEPTTEERKKRRVGVLPAGLAGGGLGRAGLGGAAVAVAPPVFELVGCTAVAGVEVTFELGSAIAKSPRIVVQASRPRGRLEACPT